MLAPLLFPTLSIWTVDDLERLPEDGNRHEILHSELLVTPLPTNGHQVVAGRFGRDSQKLGAASTRGERFAVRPART